MHEEDVSIVGCALSLECFFFLSRPWSNCSATFPYNFRQITLTALGIEKEITPSTVRRYSYIGCGIRGGFFFWLRSGKRHSVLWKVYVA